MKYIILSQNLLLNKHRTPMEKILIGLLAVVTRNGKTQTTYSDKYIAKFLGITPSYVNRLLAKFKEDGIIYIKREDGRRNINFSNKTFMDHNLYKFDKKVKLGEEI